MRLDACHIFDGATLTEVVAQSAGTITAPASSAAKTAGKSGNGIVIVYEYA